MARNLMIQGTMSNAGKSLLAAGILRVLRQDGYAAAPFKSQNMALNSYVTAQGLEMGRAQVMQAEAAGIAPDVCMNPILLKPTSDVGSQVILHGKVLGSYTAQEYFRMKKDLLPEILSAYRRLQEQADVIVIEGAGSPAEINLKADDIVNMGIAELVDAPVLLVGDIDRGGVFAQLLGTVELLEEEERQRIKGFVINKFRGDERLLAPGPEMLRQRCGIPTLGVLPYLDLQIDDEDSLSERLAVRGGSDAGGRGARAAEGDTAGDAAGNAAAHRLRAAVVRLPHISNFTDFNPLLRFHFVSLYYVAEPSDLGSPDLLILPGTKNTIRDMQWLRDSGLEEAVLRYASAGGRVLGICGGYQLLGVGIADDNGSEAGGRIRGMGLLPVDTAFGSDKKLTKIRGRISGLRGGYDALNGLSVEGYEIHMGVSAQAPLRASGGAAGGHESLPAGYAGAAEVHAGPFCVLEDGRADGCVCGNIAGTYLHGLFENDAFTKRLLLLLAADHGWERELAGQLDACLSYHAFKETQYDLLADAVRAHLDISRIYEIMRL